MNKTTYTPGGLLEAVLKPFSTLLGDHLKDFDQGLLQADADAVRTVSHTLRAPSGTWAAPPSDPWRRLDWNTSEAWEDWGQFLRSGQGWLFPDRPAGWRTEESYLGNARPCCAEKSGR